MPTGKVKSYNAAEGSGWITPDDGSAEVQMFAEGIDMANPGNLKAGRRVRYELSPAALPTKPNLQSLMAVINVGIQDIAVIGPPPPMEAIKVKPI